MTLTNTPGSVVPVPPESVIEANAGDETTTSNSVTNTNNASVPQQTLQHQQGLPIQDRLILKPYSFEGIENNPSPPADVVQLWIEVGNGIDKSQTVVWKSAVDSLDFATRFVSVSADARHFVDTYTGPIIGILVEQQPAKIGMHERTCVQDSLKFATLLTIRDLSIQLQRGLLSECILLNTTLNHIFNKKKAFYKGNKGTWNVNHHLVGLPEVRLRMIERFRCDGGFMLLTQYLEDKVLYQQYFNSLQLPIPPTLPLPSVLFPKWDTLHQILQALCDAITSRSPVPATQVVHTTANNNTVTTPGTVVSGDIPPPPTEKVKEDDAIAVAQAVMKYIHNVTDDELKKIPTDQLSTIVQHDLQRIFDRLIWTRREFTYKFYAFWRALVLKLISSKSLPLKLFGWEQVGELIDACADHAPPPRQYLVQGAGCTFANGIYHYASAVTADGYAKHGVDVLYTRTIPPEEAAAPPSPSDVNAVQGGPPHHGGGAAGKKLTLFRCTMRSQQKWWFLSEADEEQPGTDRDIDYYQHKSKEHEEAHPPRTGWITCRSAGVNPPPTLEPQGLMVPPGKEYDTLEHQLAKWAIENAIVEGVLGDSTIHREVVARSTVLIKFLASMCSKDDDRLPMQTPSPPQQLSVDSPQQLSGDEMTTDENSLASSTSVAVAASKPNQYCLQTSHLLFAWKTCTRKADAAVALQVYQLLVQILPSCPSKLAVPLLKAVQTSLNESSSEKHDYLNEVAEFCSALASVHTVEPTIASNKNTSSSTPGSGGGASGTGVSAASITTLKEDVREEVLNLLWSVLTHSGASSLKSYESLKKYVTHELRVEPAGSEHRQRFLNSCITVLSNNAEKHTKGTVDETQALRMVKLTRFILEACPHQQADKFVTDMEGKLPLLLYKELVAFLNRRKASGGPGIGSSSIRKVPSSTASSQSLTSITSPVLDLKQQHVVALEERLRILRYVYGLSDANHTGSVSAANTQGGDAAVIAPTMSPTPINNIVGNLSLPMLENLWKLCDSSEDREALMQFIASASHTGKASAYEIPGVPSVGTPSSMAMQEHLLTAAFSEEVCHAVFLNLFCSFSFDYDQLGENGYRSFQFLFRKLRASTLATVESKRNSLDALWRVCLTAAKDAVASQAMKDLLSVYVALQHQSSTTIRSGGENMTEVMVTDEFSEDESFGDRIFQCLERVKNDLDAQAPSAELSAERCMRILNAAIGQHVDGGVIEGLTTSSTLARLSLLPPNASLDQAVKCLPHVMRGQACYRRIGIVAKRPQIQNNQVQQNYDNTTRMPPTVKFSLDVHPLETLISLKCKVASYCQCKLTAVKPIQINGRARGSSGNDLTHLSLNVVPEDSVIDELGIVQGCEVVFVIAERTNQNTNNPNAAPPVTNTTARSLYMSHDLSSVFFSNDGRFADRLFAMVLGILESLPWHSEDDKNMTDSDIDSGDILPTESISSGAYKLVWDLLLAMPTNPSVVSRVQSAQLNNGGGDTTSIASDDAMEVEITAAASGESWSQLLDVRSFDRSVYVLLTIDAGLQPAPEALSTIQPPSDRDVLEKQLIQDAVDFRRTFIDAGGFHAVVRFFAAAGNEKENHKQVKTRRGNAVALRILKSCLYGNIIRDSFTSSGTEISQDDGSGSGNNSLLDDAGSQLMKSLSDVDGLLRSLTSMVVDDKGISSATISDVLRFLRLLFRSQNAASSFVALPDAERFLVTLLMWDEGKEAPVRSSSSINAAMQVRRGVHDLILQTQVLADRALPWLIHGIDNVDVAMESTSEYFDVLEKLVSAANAAPSRELLATLGTIVCKKLVSCPRPGNETDLNELSTGVLCGCLKLLRALIEHGGGDNVLREGANVLLNALGTQKWSDILASRTAASRSSGGILSAVVSSPLFRSRTPRAGDDEALVDLMGAIFDGFLTPGGIVSSSSFSSVAICCDKESRRRGFDVVSAAARSCHGDAGYMALVDRVNGLIDASAPQIRHHWGQLSSNSNGENTHTRSRGGGSSKYSGLRNQGCTCYMNSVLQQLIMMPELRDSMCSAPLPAALRSIGSGISSKLADLVGKRISLQWENGISYDAMVESYDDVTGMHTISYLPIQIAKVGSGHQQQVDPDEISRLPPCLPDEFILSEGRPLKETGVYDILPDPSVPLDEGGGVRVQSSAGSHPIKETVDEASSRRLLEEFQRTFIHLKVGSKGRCFDPRALVEACSCLKLEFDVWQQNDASEFATKLLDRLEISLKRWAPSHFRYMDHTFGLKQTKQKICRQCGLKTNREEKLLNIDCQIRGKSDIHEALSAMTEVEIMEGSNRVYCDHCKENTDTILKSAISTLPNILILSLKRFDLDFTTFETVKLNSRCAFGQTLNMKQFTLEGLEALERAAAKEKRIGDPKPMETEENIAGSEVEDPLGNLPDEDYEYRLVGVLVHAGVAQGGHYYSFIKDRNPGSEDKWFRFDDEDVTPFDPALIETECFGGKVKKETKWPNGQVHTVEQEQFANALMLFYEKVKPTDLQPEEESKNSESQDRNISALPTTTGYDVFEPDVLRANATHQRQSFLFDAEFQAFLKGMLGVCRHSLNNEGLGTGQVAHSAWRGLVIQMILSYVFDVLLYASDSSNFCEWTRMLEEVLMYDMDSSITFIQKLARKTREVSSNWLRTYLLECPDNLIRSSSAQIFSSAIRACCASNEELKALDSWSRAWREQLAELNKLKAEGSLEYRETPCALTSKWAELEDIQKIGSGGSSLGIIISQLNVLLEAMPRCWRFSSELCLFIRFLALISNANGEFVLRRPMIEALIPARLIAIIGRDRLSSVFRESFPGSSVAQEIANTQIRTETNPTAHVLPMSGNPVMNADLNSPRGASASDVTVLLEALECIAGLPGVVSASLVRETDDNVRGRQRYVLSENAIKALSTVFRESCAPGVPGMGQREIEAYLHRSGIDTGSLSTQKILEMLSKYPTTSGSDQRGTYLSLEGFLAYYRDCVQSNDLRLRLDLHTFGFRPDLSRRSHEARFFLLGERETMRFAAESVAYDVAECLKEKSVDLGTLANFALASTVHLYSVAYSVSEPLMEYLVAGATYKKETDALINRTLVAIYSTPTDWGGNEQITGLTTLLRVVASTPGDDQQQRIARMMHTNTKAARNVDFGAGLLQVLRGLHRLRQSHNFNHDVHFTFGRYMQILKELHGGCYPVFEWMNDHRSQWTFIERELLESRNPNANHNQVRNEYGPREVDGNIALDQNTHSDSDMAGMDDSADDEDSQFDNMDNLEHGPNLSTSMNDSPQELMVQEAGNPVVNGTYIRDGMFENACRYVREGTWNGGQHKFHIFLCNVSNNTKHWYISIVPHGGSPGTSSDIDFYTAPMTPGSKYLAPVSGWVKAQEGKDPPPKILFLGVEDEEVDETDESPLGFGNGTIVEDDSKYI